MLNDILPSLLIKTSSWRIQISNIFRQIQNNCSSDVGIWKFYFQNILHCCIIFIIILHITYCTLLNFKLYVLPSRRINVCESTKYENWISTWVKANTLVKIKQNTLSKKYMLNNILPSLSIKTFSWRIQISNILRQVQNYSRSVNTIFKIFLIAL